MAAYISKFPTSQLSPGPPSVARSAGAGLREQLAVVRGESAPSALIEIDAVAAGADRARRPRLPRKPTRTRPRPREWSPVTLYQDVAESKLASGFSDVEPLRVPVRCWRPRVIFAGPGGPAPKTGQPVESAKQVVR